MSSITVYHGGVETVERPDVLAEHRPNNQMCLRSQALIDRCLHYEGIENA